MDDARELNPLALLTAAQAALYAGLVDGDGKPKVSVIVNWRNRGHLRVATDDEGNELRDDHGKRLYRLIDVAKADAMTAQRAGRMAQALARRTAA